VYVIHRDCGSRHRLGFTRTKTGDRERERERERERGGEREREGGKRRRRRRRADFAAAFLLLQADCIVPASPLAPPRSPSPRFHARLRIGIARFAPDRTDPRFCTAEFAYPLV